MLLHQLKAAQLRLFAHGPTRQQFFAVGLVADRGVEGTEEEVEHGRTMYLDQRPELVYFQRSLFLVFVVETVWHVGDVIAEVFTHRYRKVFTLHFPSLDDAVKQHEDQEN